jgi:hypothetical protein
MFERTFELALKLQLKYFKRKNKSVPIILPIRRLLTPTAD